MAILDIHTHQGQAPLGKSIVSTQPINFAPREGEFYSVGIHPWTLDGLPSDETYRQLEQAAQLPCVLAIGEAGLDRLAKAPLSLQTEVFEAHIRLSEAVQKPLVIHCVRAFAELLSLKRQYRPRMPWVIHGFRRGLPLAQQLLAEGMWLSLGEHYQREVAKAIPLDRLLTETDESLLDIHEITTRLAKDRDMTPAELTQIVADNARRVFGNPH